jgi:hypothetical protein
MTRPPYFVESGKHRPISEARKIFYSIATLALFLLLIYSNSFHCGWHLDDFHSITENPNIQLQRFTWENIRKALHSDLNYPEKLYRPIAGLTFALNFFVSGADPFSYHLVNLIIHWLSSSFLCSFIGLSTSLPFNKHTRGAPVGSHSCLLSCGPSTLSRRNP